MNGQINSNINGQINGGETNQTEKKIAISLTIDEMVGLVMEWMNGYDLSEWVQRLRERMQHKYDIGKVEERDKVGFLIAVYETMIDSYHRDIIKRFLDNYRGE